MGTILDKIIAEKYAVVEQLNNRKQELETASKHKQVSFLNKLAAADTLSIISEFKRASPSKGDININLDPAVQTKNYEQYGADAISVLTDTPFFKGSFEDLQTVRSTVEVPLLCKDFIIDPIQIDFAKHYGANLILLIVAALDDQKLKSLYDYAIEKDLEVLVEVHNEEEAERAIAIGAPLIGVNNRNLKTFEVSLETTERLAPMIKKSGSYLVSESGIATMDDIQRVVAAGANVILVGETFMKSANLESTLKEMKVKL
ncbi:indole-3-glycerol phosphate synthase TrpC [Niallia sp. 01092]|uniref:indole-3-glycerol phosphate synthase TrpC n=1 Tax=unclassified Niallia TaxID=2837522 RepID=UPI003FD465C3